jgi:hypothetical protein
VHQLAVEARRRAEASAAQNAGPFGDRVEHRLDICRRAADDAQDLGRRGLPVERLLRFVEQADVLDRDHRLVGEDLQQPHVLVGEQARLLAADPIEPITSPSRIIGTPRLPR